MYTVYTFFSPDSDVTVILATVLSSVNLYSINPSTTEFMSSSPPDNITLSVSYGTVNVYTVTSLSNAISNVPTLDFSELRLLFELRLLVTFISFVIEVNSSMLSIVSLASSPLNDTSPVPFEIAAAFAASSYWCFPFEIAVNVSVSSTSLLPIFVRTATRLLSFTSDISLSLIFIFVNFNTLPSVVTLAFIPFI